MFVLKIVLFIAMIIGVGITVYKNLVSLIKVIPVKTSKDKLESAKADLILKKEKLDNIREISKINKQLAKIEDSIKDCD